MTSISQEKNIRLNPALVLAIGLAAGSFAAVFIRAAQNAGMPSHLIAAGRMLLAGIALTPVVLHKYRDELTRLDRRDLMMAMFAGFWLIAHFLIMITALETTSIMIFTVILNTGPLWVGLLERTFLKAKLTRGVWFGLFVTISGSIFIALTASGGNETAGGNSLYGIILTLFASIAGATYMTIGRSVRRKVSLLPYIWILFSIGGLIGLAFVFLTSTPITGHSAEGYFWLVMLVLIPQLIGHAGFNYALGYFPATIISLSGQILTVTAAVAAFFFFGEIPTFMQIVGSSIIALGVIVAILARNRSARQRQA